MSTKEYFEIYLSTTQISIAITKLNSTLCFPGVNRVYMNVTTEMNGKFSGTCSGS